MPYFNGRYAYKLGKIARDATHIHICVAEPMDYAQTVEMSLGIAKLESKWCSADDRCIEIHPIKDGKVTESGVARVWALVSLKRHSLLAANRLGTEQKVTAGNTWSLGELYIRHTGGGS